MAEPIELCFLPASGSAEDAELLNDFRTWLEPFAGGGTFRIVLAASGAPEGPVPSRVFLLPCSPDLAAQPGLWGPALESALALRGTGQSAVFALHLRPHGWAGSPVAALPGLPENGLAVVEWEERARAWAHVLGSLRMAAARGFAPVPVSPPPTTPEEIRRERLRQRLQESRTDSLRKRPEQPPPPARRELPVPPGPQAFTVPHPPGDLFVGRDDLVREIAERLREPRGDRRPAPIVTLLGGPGAGKTAVAIAFAHRHRDDYPGGVFWLDAAAGDEEVMFASLVDALVDARFRRAQAADSSLSGVRDALRDRGKWLLILDGVVSRRLSARLQSFLFFLDVPEGCGLVITARVSPHKTDSQHVEIEPLSEADATALLTRAAGRPTPDAAEAAAAVTIARSLAGLPAALQLAGGHLRRRPDMTFVEYLRQLDEVAGSGADDLLPSPSQPDSSSVDQRAAFALAWAALSPTEQDVFRGLASSLESPLSLRRLTLLTGIPEQAVSAALARLEEASFLDEPRGRRPPRARASVVALSGRALGDLASFARPAALRALSEMRDVAVLEEAAKELTLAGVRADVEATVRLLGKRVPPWLETLLQILEAQSPLLDVWDAAREPDGLLVQLRDGALEAGVIADDLRQRAEGALRARGRAWLRRRFETSHGTGRLLGAHEGAVTAVTMSEDGRLAFSGSEDGAVKCWSLPSGALVADLPGHTGAVRDIVLTPDNRMAITASDDGTLKVWTLPDCAEQSTLDWHHAGVYSVVVSSDGRTAESRSHDGHTCLWDLTTGAPITASASTSAPMPRAPASAGDVAVTASAQHDLIVEHVPSGQAQRALVGHTGRILCMALHEGGRQLVSGGADWMVRTWDTGRGAPLVPGTDVAQTAISRDGRFAISAGTDGTLAIWDVATGILRRTLRSSHGRSFGMAAMPGPCFATAGEGSIQIWDADTGQVLRTILSPAAQVLALAVSPTGRRAAMVGWIDRDGRAGGRLFLWDLEIGTLLHVAECELQTSGIAVLDDERALIAEPRAGAVRCVSFETGSTTHTFSDLGRPSGAVVAAAGRFFCPAEGGIVVADAGSGEPLARLPITLTARTPYVLARCLAVTPDGRFLAAATSGTERRQGSARGGVVLYDVAADRPVGHLRLPVSPVSCSLSPDGGTLFLGANVDVRRQVVKGWRDGGTGGWFKEDVLHQPRVFFVDREG